MIIKNIIKNAHVKCPKSNKSFISVHWSSRLHFVRPSLAKRTHLWATLGLEDRISNIDASTRTYSPTFSGSSPFVPCGSLKALGLSHLAFADNLSLVSHILNTILWEVSLINNSLLTLISFDWLQESHVRFPSCHGFTTWKENTANESKVHNKYCKYWWSTFSCHW